MEEILKGLWLGSYRSGVNIYLMEGNLSSIQCILEEPELAFKEPINDDDKNVCRVLPVEVML